MDFKQLKIMVLALSLPGSILVIGIIYQWVVENKYLSSIPASLIFGSLLLAYIIIIVKRLYN